MKKHQDSLRKLAKELQSKLAFDEAEDQIQLSSEQIEKLPQTIRSLGQFAFACLESENGPIIGAFEKKQLEDKLKSFLIIASVLQLKRTNQVLETIAIVFKHKTDLSQFENDQFIDILFEDFISKAENISSKSYFQILGSYHLKSSPEFNIYIAKIVCLFAKKIRLHPQFHNSLNLSVSMGNCLLLLQNLAFTYGTHFNIDLISQYKNVMTNLQSLPEKSSYDVLASRSIIAYLILTVYHDHGETKLKIEEIRGMFQRVTPKGNDIKVYLEIVRKMIADRDIREAVIFFKLGIRFLRKFRQKVAKQRRQFEKRVETFYLTFAQYMEAHQNLLKSIKHPFYEEVLEKLIKLAFKELKQKGEQNMFEVQKSFSNEERAFMGIIMTTFYTKDGERREIIRVGTSKNISASLNNNPDSEDDK